MPRQAAASAGFAADGTTRHLITPPADLNDLERAEFIAVVTGSPANHFLPSDTAMLSIYARAVVAERVAAGELASNPVTDGKASPWLPLWLAAVRTVTTTARRLNINPCGRQTTPASEPVRVSYYERMSLEGRRDDEHH
jgi:hypothetical protein